MTVADHLTVVTTTFRNGDDLVATLASARLSGLTGFEWVIVDGLPAADSDIDESLARGELDPSVSVTVLHGPDKGPYHAMNKAILRSRGDWLWFMNSGDQFVSTSHCLYERIVGTTARWAVGHSRIAGRPDVLGRQQGSLGELILGDTPCHQAVLFQRELFADVGLYDLRYRIGADYDVMLSAAQRYGALTVDQPVCLYQGGGLSDQQRARSQAEYQLIRQRRGATPPRSWPLAWARVAFRSRRFRTEGRS